MDNAHTEDITDVVGSHETSYMLQICNKIFIQNITDPVSFIDSTCRNWFLEALQHCSEMLFLQPEPKMHTWLFDQVMNLRSFIFPRSGDTSLLNKKPQIRVHPRMLSRSDCNHLFIEAAKDYIDMAPKYTMCLEENFYFGAFLKALLGVCAIYVLFMFVRSIAKRQLWTLRRKKITEPFHEFVENETIMNKAQWLNKRTLARQKFEIDHFKIENSNPLKMLYDPPTIAIRVKRKQLSDAMLCLVKTNPMVDEQRNGFVRNTSAKTRGYALDKLNTFLNKRSYCRIILDLGYDEDESDSDGNSLQYGKSFSGGDQFFHGSHRCDMEESADTSSVNSVKHHSEGAGRARRYTSSKFKKMYLQSLNTDKVSGIPTAEMHRVPLPRRDSSNSVAILDRRDSRISTKKGSELSPSLLKGRAAAGRGAGAYERSGGGGVAKTTNV